MVTDLFLFLMFSIVTSKESVRFQYVHEQEFDTSCGFSAVASLLDIYWGIATSEIKIVHDYVLPKINTLKNKEYTASLLDLSRIISAYGIANKGFRMNYKQLEKVMDRYSPVLVHYEKLEVHFALVLWASDEIVVVVDPARGAEWLTRVEFESRWDGVVLLTASETLRSNREVIRQVVSREMRKKMLLEKWSW